MAAKYSTKTLTVLPDTEGYDLDGDGEIDNELPKLLALVDQFTDEDMSLEGVNTTIAELQADGKLILLLDALYSGGDLSVDLLLASLDADTGVLTMDPSSYDDQGDPNSHFAGSFLDETAFSATTSAANLPFPVVSGEPPVQIPIVDATISGDFYSLDSEDGSAGLGVIVGALPVQGLVDQVVQKIVPIEEPAIDPDPEVTYYDSAAYLDMTRNEFMSWVTDLLNQNMADLYLEDGSRAVSAALSWQVEIAVEWPD
jgi:hypothetical protein